VDISSESDAGKWKVVFFWPKDFTFICPTEIAAFGKLNGEFEDRDTVLYGVSTDSEFVHLNWRLHNDDLRNLPIPMLADVKRELSTALGEFAPQLSPEALTAAKAAASIMGMNNVYYRFTHLMGGDYPSTPGKLRMNVMAKPGVDKVVKHAGLTSEQVQAAVRIASVVHAAAATVEAEDVLAA
jgi:peroxiredoxin